MCKILLQREAPFAFQFSFRFSPTLGVANNMVWEYDLVIFVMQLKYHEVKLSIYCCMLTMNISFELSFNNVGFRKERTALDDLL